MVGAGIAFFFSILTGSSDAIVQTFNLSITNLSSDFGISPIRLGSIAWVCGEMGRCLSPVAAVTIILADIAKVEPKQLVYKLIFPISVGMIITLIVFSIY